MAKPNVNRNQMQLKIEALEERRLMTFNPATTYSVASNPFRIVVDEFRTGSGIDDIAVSNYPSNTVTVLPGKPNGTFGAATVQPSGTNPHGMGAGDLNCDGNLDLAATHWNNANFSVLFGTGGRRFMPPLNYPSATRPSEVLIADFTNDGKPDVVTAHFIHSLGNNTIRFSKGNCSKTLDAPVVVNANGPWLQDAEAADLNNDGNLDLVVSHHNSGSIGVLLGNGNGTFKPAVNYPAKSRPAGLALGDINGDSIEDIVVAQLDHGEAGIRLGNGNGTFKAVDYVPVGAPNSRPWEVVIADFGDFSTGNGLPDGRNDFAMLLQANNAVAVCYNPSFSCSTHGLLAMGPQDLVTADFNDDSLPDLATPNYNSVNVSVLINTATPPSPPPLVPPETSADSIYVDTPIEVFAPVVSSIRAEYIAAAISSEPGDLAPVSTQPQRAIRRVTLEHADIDAIDMWSPL